MRRKTVIPGDASDFGVQAKKHKPRKKKASHGSGHGGHGSVRTAHYKGFEIEIETHYKFKVNGKPLMVHAHVLNSGHVHSSSLPNYGWSSAVDFVEQLIDSFPDDFQPSNQGKSSKRKSNKKSKRKNPKKTSRKKSVRKKKTSDKKKPSKKKSTKGKSKKKATKTRKSARKKRGRK